MKDLNFKKIFKMCFGKDKNPQLHAIAMLTLYLVFFLIVILVVRGMGNDIDNTNNRSNNNINIDKPSNEDVNNEINYTYSYTIDYDTNTAVYLGKRIDDKQKFTVINNGNSTNYAIINGNYLIFEDGIYKITDSLDDYFKYCDVEKILKIVVNEISDESGNSKSYSVDNVKISKFFNDKISGNNNGFNNITIIRENNTIKEIDMNLSNYISEVQGKTHSLVIKMNFADVGKTEDFEIKVN